MRRKLLRMERERLRKEQQAAASEFGTDPSADEEQRIYSGGAYGYVPPPPEKKAGKK